MTANDIAIKLRDLKKIRPTDGSERMRLTHKLCDLYEIFMPAVYQAASNGNVICKQAVNEAEKVLRQYEE